MCPEDFAIAADITLFIIPGNLATTPHFPDQIAGKGNIGGMGDFKDGFLQQYIFTVTEHPAKAGFTCKKRPSGDTVAMPARAF